ncbi:MAG: hypothetical protein P8018_04110 [Acidobacteriota bacterium]
MKRPSARGKPAGDAERGEGIVARDGRNLWVQLSVFGAVSIGIYMLGGLLLVIAGLAVFVDSWSCGMGAAEGRGKLGRFPPAGWALGVEALLPVFFPLYLALRGRAATKPGRDVWLFCVVVAGAIPIFIVLLHLIHLASAH